MRCGKPATTSTTSRREDRARQHKLAQHIVEQKEGEFEPEAFEDHYETALIEVIKKKQATSR